MNRKTAGKILIAAGSLIIALSAYYYGNSEHIPLRFEKRIEGCNI